MGVVGRVGRPSGSQGKLNHGHWVYRTENRSELSRIHTPTGVKRPSFENGRKAHIVLYSLAFLYRDRGFVSEGAVSSTSSQ